MDKMKPGYAISVVVVVKIVADETIHPKIKGRNQAQDIGKGSNLGEIKHIILTGNEFH